MYVNLHKDINNLTEDVTKAMKLLHASKNCVPENIEKWFKLPNLGNHLSSGSWEKMHQDFIRDENKEGMYNSKWIYGYSSENIEALFTPREIVIPLDENNGYSETLASTLVDGPLVMHDEIYEAIFENNFEIAKTLKECLEQNSPYSKTITENTIRRLKQALLTSR